MRIARMAAFVIALMITASLFAQDMGSISLFGSGIANRQAFEYDTYEARTVRTWTGGVGIGVERRITPAMSLEASVEVRRDVVERTGAAFCHEQYHGTCFVYHRIELTSTPVVVRGLYSHPIVNRAAVFGAVGVRFVPDPTSTDLNAGRPTPDYVFRVETNRRLNTEIAAGSSWLATNRLALFAEVRFLVANDAEWDPRRRVNAGIRVRF